MGIAFSDIIELERSGLLPASGGAILDVGSSNLYCAERDDILALLGRRVGALTADHHGLADRLAAGSYYDPVSGGTNGAFAGELFEAMGLRYLSIDIADGYRTQIIDLNRQSLPAELAGTFDLVLNFGTTEHVLNQYNSFKVIHEATRAGGYIFHSLPSVGFVDHGYVTYTGRFFFDLAGYNDYEVVAFRFEGPAEGREGNLLESSKSYRTYFPVLDKTLEDSSATDAGRRIAAMSVPDVTIRIVYRKRQATPYWGAVESSTSVGTVSEAVISSYWDSDAAGQAGPASAGVPTAGLRGRLADWADRVAAALRR